MSEPQARKPKQPLHGWINLYKPKGMTSTQAVGAVKRLLRPEKIGHAGTLDPLAEGVLPLALGEATKTVPYMMDARKAYAFTICFGEERSTGDAEGEVVARSDVWPSAQDIIKILPKFTGKIRQVPPAYSAIKVDGKRAYDLARAGQEVVLKAREVEIFNLVIASAAKQSNVQPDGKWITSSATPPRNDDTTTFLVQCSKGTYVRSLAVDIARALGTVGYVSYLKRTQVGRFEEQSTISLDFLENFMHNAPDLEQIAASEWLLPLSDALDDIPALTVDAVAEAALRCGRFIPDTFKVEGDELAVFSQGKLVAIAVRREGFLCPRRVFNV